MRQKYRKLTKTVINNAKKPKAVEMWAPDREEDKMSRGRSVVAGGDR